MICKCFLEAVKQGKSTARVVQWAACLENQSVKEHKHYHMAIKLSGTRRWYGVFKYLKRKHNRITNFSNKRCDYIAAYRYAFQHTKNAMKQISTNIETRRSTVAKKASDSETPVKRNKSNKIYFSKNVKNIKRTYQHNMENTKCTCNGGMQF